MNQQDLIRHYKRAWSSEKCALVKWEQGPMPTLDPEFRVAVFAPHGGRDMWAYATCGMAAGDSSDGLELHLFAPHESDELVELLTVVAHFHKTGERLDLGHTVNFGRPWLPGSRCEHGFVSLPYLDGPKLERYADPKSNRLIRCLWLIPVTRQEVAYKKKNGVDALEARFQEVGLDYVNPARKDVVSGLRLTG